MRISLENVGKKFNRVWIFKSVSTEFQIDHCYGLIGFNGSGKSTLLQLISGFVSPNEGSVTWEANSKIPVEDWSKYISISSPSLSLFEEFTVEESIELHAKFKNLSKEKREILEEVDLYGHRSKTLDQLSSGMRQRLKLALAIYSESRVLLLDEPCANLDARWSNWYEGIMEIQKKNRLCIVCSNSQKNELSPVDAGVLNISDFQANSM